MRTLQLGDLFRASGDCTELRAHENTNIGITLLKGAVTSNIRTEEAGLSARVRQSGRWGMASANDISEKGVSRVLEAAALNARSIGAAKGAVSDALLPARPGLYTADFRTDKPHVTQKDMIDALREMDAYIEKKCSGLISRMLSLRCFHHEKRLLTSEGADSYIFLPRSHIYIVLTAERDGQPVELYGISGGRGEYEDLELSSVYAKIDDTYERLMRKKEGVYADAGEYECVVMPELVGILAHEAVGHTVEADLVRNGSVAGPNLNKVVASELVTLTDFANTALGETCDVPVYVDDEGVEARDTVVIDKGVLKSFLHNRESASEFNTEPTGNARGFAFSDEPLIRMRNTAILPGTDKLEDMIASIKKGYLLCNTLNGQADMTGEFMFGISFGYEINDGKKGKAILDTTVSGVAFETLKTVTAISDGIEWSSSGFCGKKQAMSVSCGGAALKCRLRVGGK